jgi:serine phosphatase RsbU (regulator of sigma subunit)
MEQAARRSTTRWRWRALQVGGDRYDAFQVSDGSTELVVGDVSGHDQEAAVTAQGRNVLRGIAPERPHRDHAQTLGPGAIVLYTDGLAERRGSSSTTGRS